MLIIRKDEVNNLIATVSMNKTLANPYYLFSFQHIASKERVSFIPQVITSNCRYDKFRFVEFSTQNLNASPPQVHFPYLGQYYYSIYEQLTSGNTDPSLAFNKLESGRAVVIVGNDTINECLFEPYISNDENFSNVIYLSEDEDNCIPDDCCISNSLSNWSSSNVQSTGLDKQNILTALSNFSGQTYNGVQFRHILKIEDNASIVAGFNSNSLPINGGAVTVVRQNSSGEIAYNIFNPPPSGSVNNNGIYITNSNGSLSRQFISSSFDKTIGSIIFQPSCFEILDDGSCIFIGAFSGYNGTSLSGVVKFDSSGFVDSVSSAATFTVSGSTPNDYRSCILKKDRNGKILFVSDNLSSPILYNNIHVGPIFRINEDLTLDNTFQFSTSSYVLSVGNTRPDVSFSDDDKIIISWRYISYSGYNSPSLIILNNDGTIYTDFISPLSPLLFFTKDVQGTLIDNDKIYVYGNFDNYSGSSNNSIVKIDFSGNVDNTFVSQATTATTINGMFKTNDGNYLLSGNFTFGYGGYNDSVIKINQFGQPMMCENPPTPSPTPSVTPTPTITRTVTPTPTVTRTVTPTVTPTATITPSITPTLTPTTSCILVTQYLKAELQSCNNFQLSLWNTSGFTGPANALCDYVVSGTAYGDLGTVYNGTETIQNNDHTHSFNLNPVLLPGECISGFTVNNVVFNGCVCPPNLILP